MSNQIVQISTTNKIAQHDVFLVPEAEREQRGFNKTPENGESWRHLSHDTSKGAIDFHAFIEGT